MSQSNNSFTVSVLKACSITTSPETAEDVTALSEVSDSILLSETSLQEQGDRFNMAPGEIGDVGGRNKVLQYRVAASATIITGKSPVGQFRL